MTRKRQRSHASMQEHADAVAKDLHISNADQALQAVLELMLTSQPTADVMRKLQSWIDYLQEFKKG